MAFKYADRVKEFTTTIGTGTITLGGAATGFRTFASALAVGDTTVYCIQGPSEWEVGYGTLASATLLTRTSIIASSAGGLQTNFSAGTKDVFITNPGGRMLVPDADGTATPTGSLEIFRRDVGGRSMLAMVGPSGLDTTLQPLIGRNKIATWTPAGNGTVIVADGAAAMTATGTATAANVATTNLHQMQKRLDYLVTTASTTAVAGFRYPAAQWTIGGSGTDATQKGGFTLIIRFGPATGVGTASNRCFVGMSSSTVAPTDVEPSTITNIVGCGWDSADNNIQIMHRGAGAITKIDTGIPVSNLDRTECYELSLFSPPGTIQRVGYEFRNLITNAAARGTIFVNLPSATTLLAPRGWMSVGGTSSVIGISLMSAYLESDF